MQTQIKQRIIGAVVVLIVFILFLPVLFHKQRPVVQSFNQVAVSGQTQGNAAAANNVAANTQSIELKLPVKTAATLQQRTSAPAAQQAVPSGQVVQPKQSQVVKQPIVQSKQWLAKKPVQKAAPRAVTPSPHKAAVPAPVAVAVKKVVTNAQKTQPLPHSKVIANNKVTTQPQSKGKVVSGVDVTNNLLVPTDIDTSAAWVLQVASFSNVTNANHLVSLLRKKGYSAYVRNISMHNGARIVRVFVGPEIHLEQLKKWQARIKTDLGVSGFIRKYKI